MMSKIIFLLAFFFCNFLVVNGQDDLKTKYFFKAINNENYSKITRYLDSGVSINHVLEDKRTYQGNTYNSRKSRTALLQAIKLQKTDLVKFLVENGADVNQSIEVTWYEECSDCPYNAYYRKPERKKAKTYKPISWTLEWGDTTIVDYLISKGANYSDEISLIKKAGNTELLQYFSNKGIQFDFQPEDLETVYMLGYKRPYVIFLLDEGVIANARTLNQMVQWKDKELLVKALNNGSDVNAFYKDKALNMCPICEAVLNCDLDITKLLIEEYNAKTAPICSAYFGGNTMVSRLTPMQIARDNFIGKCKGSNDDMIEYFLFAKDIQQEKQQTETNSTGKN
jgi:hypothetical protein